ncbi:MAG: hypothetical protein PHF57_09565 [Methanoregula sp.]|nr:hypothetical protein [Methanoregula sp.]MDD5188440.1 hypothetical protein [Methanoregula sp.]
MMMGHDMGSHTGCMSHCGCGCGGMMSVEEEIQALEVHRQHLKLQMDLVEKRIAGLKHVGK